MARYTGPRTKIARKFGDPIFGEDRSFEKKKYPPGQHGSTKRRGQRSDYAIQLLEKQKAKYTYGLLERQFRNLFLKAKNKKGGVTGDILLQLLESRLDNVVYRLGFANSRRAARQLVTHRHVTLNGKRNNIPSTLLRPGDLISISPKSRDLEVVKNNVAASNVAQFGWLEFNKVAYVGKFLAYPEVEKIPENINVQLIVELYSK
jgi:small subunit ribosomal protein S4